MRSPISSFTARLAGAALALATATAAAPAAQAQDTGVLQFSEAGTIAFTSISSGQLDVGRLKGTLLDLNGAAVNTPLDLFCVDLYHFVTFDLSGWNVYLTNLGTGDVSRTRQGGINPATMTPAYPGALDQYRKQAWLADQYATVTTAADTAGIQAAMWLQFEPSLAPWFPATLDEALATATWLVNADAFSLTSDFTTYDWSRFTIITDASSVGLGSNDYRGLQELVTIDGFGATTTTPEPAGMALLATGLAGLGVTVRRRTRQQGRQRD